MQTLLLRAFDLHKRWVDLAPSTRYQYRCRLYRDLKAVLARSPTQAEGIRLQTRKRQLQENLFLCLDDATIPPTNKASERATFDLGVYDASGQTDTFRVTEDRTYGTSKDKDYVIPESASVGIIHPLQLTVEERSIWGELLNDYEIVQPFVPIYRPLSTLEPETITQTEITEFANIKFIDIKVEVITLVGLLDRHGWTRRSNGGNLCEHYKTFEAASITAFIQYDCVTAYATSVLMNAGVISVQRCFFLPASGNTQGHSNAKPLLLHPVDSIASSEVLGDLMTIAAKSKEWNAKVK